MAQCDASFVVEVDQASSPTFNCTSTFERLCTSLKIHLSYTNINELPAQIKILLSLQSAPSSLQNQNAGPHPARDHRFRHNSQRFAHLGTRVIGSEVTFH
jgi:hypothetical protein